MSGCGDPPDPRTDDVPTRGHVLILADEDLRDLVEAEEFMFESIYDKATLDIRYLPEAELLKAVMNDSVRCWIGTHHAIGHEHDPQRQAEGPDVFLKRIGVIENRILRGEDGFDALFIGDQFKRFDKPCSLKTL